MKIYHYLLGLGAIALASCSNDDFLGNGNSASEKGMISFTASSPKLTRSEVVGGAAADKLSNHFVVYGTKHEGVEDGTADQDELVYNQYNVEYGANGWEYIGKNAYSSAVTGAQSIKYWDYTAVNGYTFNAFSSVNVSYPAEATDLVSVEKTTTGADVYKKGYTVTIKKDADIDKLFYSDRTLVAKTDYSNTVTLTFRNMASKVRVGFYETIPGYSVKIDKFYMDADADAAITTYKAMEDADAANFEASIQNVSKDAASNIFTVTYYDATDPSVENRATVTNSTVEYNYNLKLGDQIQAATALGTASSECTWDQTDGAYTTVFPFEANSNPMLIRCDYTLTSTDGSGETIEVKNARVVVPVQYVQWKSNYAYTYLFKISDKTNGTTGTTPTDPDDPTTGDPEGLYPITFDAVVVSATDANSTFEQETVTTVANNAVTSYQNAKVITANDEYKEGDIYVVNSDASSHDVITPTAVGEDAYGAQVYVVTTDGDAISEASVIAKLTGAINGLTLTAVDPAAELVTEVPASDGTNYSINATKFTAAAATTYAYVYCTTKYVAPEYEAAADYDAATTYYYQSSNGTYFAAAGITAANYDTNKANLFVMKTAGVAGVYDVKVIKVK